MQAVLAQFTAEPGDAPPPIQMELPVAPVVTSKDPAPAEAAAPA